MPEPYTHAADTDAVCGILDAHAADTDTMSGILDAHSADTMNHTPMQPIPMAMMLMPFPCPVVTVTDAHGTDTHAVDTDTMSGILDAHAADTIPMQSIPMPCVVSSGGDRHLCNRYHEPDTHAVDTHGHDADAVSVSYGDSYRCSWN